MPKNPGHIAGYFLNFNILNYPYNSMQNAINYLFKKNWYSKYGRKIS